MVRKKVNFVPIPAAGKLCSLVSPKQLWCWNLTKLGVADGHLSCTLSPTEEEQQTSHGTSIKLLLIAYALCNSRRCNLLQGTSTVWDQPSLRVILWGWPCVTSTCWSSILLVSCSGTIIAPLQYFYCPEFGMVPNRVCQECNHLSMARSAFVVPSWGVYQ